MAAGPGKLSGVIAAIATPIDERGAPDRARATTLAKHLLENGCDGLNVLGTTGEATSFSLAERKAVMSAYKAAGLPMDRLMVGTGAASLSDAIELTRHAAECGFAGALVLPPFFYKGVSDEGLGSYIAEIAAATAQNPVPLYLYHFPQQSGVPWSVALVRQLLAKHGKRIAGLKDSSGDIDYARAASALSPDFAVFPSSEAALMEARTGAFAGVISGSANVTAEHCARVWHHGDQSAFATAVAIRKLFDGKPLVPGVKALLAHIHGDPSLARMKPPLMAWSAADAATLAAGYDALRAKRVA